MQRINELIDLLTEGDLTVAQTEELEGLLLKTDPATAKELLASSFRDARNVQGMPANIAASMLDAILLQDKFAQLKQTDVRVHRVQFLRTAWFRYAAAILLLLTGTATFLYLHNQPDKQNALAVTNKPADVLPGRSKATLTLSDGSIILLDSASIGNLAEQNGTQIMKLDTGALAYNSTSGKSGGEVLYNTISTPRGGQYRVVLPDGSKVWLNAASSITFPTAFSGMQRKIAITGEAYIEVVKRKAQPFFVEINHQARIQVLGTNFNVNAYSDESSIKTTLLEGSVKVMPGISETGNDGNEADLGKDKTVVILKPGEQSSYDPQAKKLLLNTADVDKVMAWKNGVFNFEGARLEDVMRELARWYDIEVIYKKGIPDIRFGGEMSKDLSLAGVIRGLEAAEVHFRIEEGRKLVVYP